MFCLLVFSNRHCFLVGVQIKVIATCDSSFMLPTCFPQLPTPESESSLEVERTCFGQLVIWSANFVNSDTSAGSVCCLKAWQCHSDQFDLSCVNLIFGDFVFLFLCSSLYWLIAVLRCRRCVVASQLTVFPRAQDGTKWTWTHFTCVCAKQFATGIWQKGLLYSRNMLLCSKNNRVQLDNRSKKISGLWRIYPHDKGGRQKLLIQGMTVRGVQVTVKDKNPYLVRSLDGKEEETPATKVIVGNVPISFSDQEILKSVQELGCTLRSKLILERDRDEKAKLTHCLTGRRIIYVSVPCEPLPKFIQVSDALPMQSYPSKVWILCQCGRADLCAA